MNTELLIAELSGGLQPVQANASRVLLHRALVSGTIAAGSIVLFWPSLGIRGDLTDALTTTGFWIKQLYTASIGVVGFAALDRLSRPGMETSYWTRLLCVPFAMLSAIAALYWFAEPSLDSQQFWMGSSWWRCPLYVAGLSLPVFVGLISALSRLAPTRLGTAGAAAGLVAGAAGASVYALHCAETSPGFVLLWYSLGLAAAALVGALVGGRLLRW